MTKRLFAASLLLIFPAAAAIAVLPQKHKILRVLHHAAAFAAPRNLDHAAGLSDLRVAQVSPVHPRTDVPMLDAYPGATFAIGLRRLRSGYSGPAIQVQRLSDKATQDIGFSPAGDLDVAAARAFCGAARCGVSIVYDQSGAGCGNAVQAEPARQFELITAGTPNGKPVLRSGSGSGMRVPDCAAYKTAAVDAFVVARLGSRNQGAGFRGGTVIAYPRTRDSDVWDFDWGVSAVGDAVQFQIYVLNSGYKNNMANPDGLSATYRNHLFQYEFNTATQDIRYNTKIFTPAGRAVTIAYPDAVGLVIGADATGKNVLQDGDLAEIILYGAPQAPRDEISAAQSAYWDISEPPPTVTTADGFVWAPVYHNDWHVKFPVNGRNYFTESPADVYSMWRATNASGPLWRFEVRRGDIDNVSGNERSELDGGASPPWPVDTTIQISYALLLEPGAPVINASWNALGQYHYVKTVYPPATFSVGLRDDFWTISKDGPHSMIEVWRSSERITHNAWYDFFIEQKVSSSRQDDVLKVWINKAQVLNLSGSLFPHRESGFWKIGIYRGYVVPQTEAVRYANLEVVDKAVTPIDSRIMSPLPHPEPK